MNYFILLLGFLLSFSVMAAEEETPSEGETPSEEEPAVPSSEEDDLPDGAHRLFDSGRADREELLSSQDIDYFYLDLEDEGGGYLHVTLSQRTPGTKAVLGWRLELYSENDLTDSLYSTELPESSLSTDYYIGLDAQKYFFKVTSIHPDFVPTTPEGENVTYYLSAELTEKTFFEKTPNKTPETATALQLNKTTLGGLSFADDVDFFRFALTNDDAITVKLAQDRPGTDATIGWRLALFAETDLATPLQVFNLTDSSLVNQVQTNLTTGVYYIRVSSIDASRVPKTPYQLTVNAASLGNADIVCAQVITYAQNPLTNRWVAFPTPCDVPNGWFSSLTPPAGVEELFTVKSPVHASFSPETGILTIPALDIPGEYNRIEVYSGKLRWLQEQQDAVRFELMMETVVPVNP